MNTPSIFAYLSKEAATALYKCAEENAPKKKKSPLGAIIAGGLGMGTGMLAGAGAAHLADKLYQHGNEGRHIPVPYLSAAIPVLGAGLGLAYARGQAHQREEMSRASEDPDHRPQ